ncbi:MULTISPECIES: hypothetical protein [Pseudoalteromonas]|uniref:Orphan protein n=2 Tax=Pseudoalteromonas TaxID=53246 RepID=A0AAC9XYQ7_9GAMM|nr:MULTISPECIES: hypothetical protein [Pseudoalteromonas]ASM55054.1 hypothetical protein PNIG_a3115 [Pseudoalteromonas nigrifaciens]MBB1372227.1 hypothetical protein [Pseudoalteromonas sp. SR45-4]MBB1405830.1 hypothetical protein [Pseudoalteromonas sp. SG44-5]MBE0421198.1 hypothetical protein [Pseudoalteromonas nigrifaciens]MBH0070431.1 hypothetical protein [Pseudoalteromonas sp. NZS127]|tara:strand:- start:9298 stop:9783 length:486 start_codon:yes stop_codon:yes gene_type:complete
MKMSKENFDDYLNESLNTLDKDITPRKNLWPGIERAIINAERSTQKHTTIWPKLTAVAACSVAVLIAVNIVFITPEPKPAVAISDYFLAQKNSLLVAYKNQDALTSNWQVQLQELEEAELAIKQVLENEPQNQALLTMLAQIYQQQLDLINKVHAPRWQHI